MPTEEHEAVVNKTLGDLEKKGYRCVPVRKPMPDIIVFKDGKVVGYEILVGHRTKYRRQRKARLFEKINYYDEIIYVEEDRAAKDVDDDPKARGKIISGFRISIPKDIREEMGLQLDEFYEMEILGKNKDKLLITFFKLGKRG